MQPPPEMHNVGYQYPGSVEPVESPHSIHSCASSTGGPGSVDNSGYQNHHQMPVYESCKYSTPSPMHKQPPTPQPAVGHVPAYMNSAPPTPQPPTNNNLHPSPPMHQQQHHRSPPTPQPQASPYPAMSPMSPHPQHYNQQQMSPAVQQPMSPAMHNGGQSQMPMSGYQRTALTPSPAPVNLNYPSHHQSVMQQRTMTPVPPPSPIPTGHAHSQGRNSLHGLSL